MLNGNIFRQAKQLLKTKPREEMTQEEVIIVKAATIPLDILPEFNGRATDQGLDVMAKRFDEARGREK